jgi:hypothetical protein
LVVVVVVERDLHILQLQVDLVVVVDGILLEHQEHQVKAMLVVLEEMDLLTIMVLVGVALVQ